MHRPQGPAAWVLVVAFVVELAGLVVMLVALANHRSMLPGLTIVAPAGLVAAVAMVRIQIRRQPPGRSSSLSGGTGPQGSSASE